MHAPDLAQVPARTPGAGAVLHGRSRTYAICRTALARAAAAPRAPGSRSVGRESGLCHRDGGCAGAARLPRNPAASAGRAARGVARGERGIGVVLGNEAASPTV